MSHNNLMGFNYGIVPLHTRGNPCVHLEASTSLSGGNRPQLSLWEACRFHTLLCHTKTCRQLHEGTCILYGQNTFRIEVRPSFEVLSYCLSRYRHWDTQILQRIKRYELHIVYGESYGLIKNTVGRLCMAFERYRPERLSIYYYSHGYLDV
jgi:hypothetical protein